MLRRSRADWPVVLASWVLLASALALLAAGTLYTDAVTLAGLRRELETAPAADRAIVVATRFTPDRLATLDAAIVPELRAVVAPTGGTVARVLRTPPYADAGADPDTVTDLVLFAAYSDLAGHAALVDGRWATPGRQPVEVTLPAAAAAALGLRTGDTRALASRLDASRRVEVTVVGTWEANAADPWWLAEPLALAGVSPGRTFTTRGPLVVADEDLVAAGLADTLDGEWRAIPALAGFTPANLDAVAALAAGADGRVNAALPFTNLATVSTKLPAILNAVDRSVLVTQAGILLLLVQFGVLGGYAVVLVAALLLERRRTETALLRARGAGSGHLLAMAFGEALLIGVPAAAAAPWLAALLVAGVRLNPALAGVALDAPLPGPATFAVATAGGLVAVLALTVPTLAASVPIAGVRAVVGRQVGRTFAQRVGLDLVLVALAVVALLQLRLYGAPLTRNARGALGVDPLLVAAPAIGLLGGAVLATRIVPRLAEVAERGLARARGLLPALGGRQLARRPLRYTRAALLLILAAALGTFAGAHAATWSRSQEDQAAFAAGADVRLEPSSRSSVPAWATGGALRALPGVTAATPLVHSVLTLGTTLRDGPLVAVDGTAVASILRGRDDDSTAHTRQALAALGEARPAFDGPAIPAGTRRLSVVVDTRLEAIPDTPALPDGLRGVTAAVVLLDGDGRSARVAAVEPGIVGRDGVRLEVPLEAGAGAATAPLRVLAVEVTLSIAGAGDTVASGRLTLRSLDASASAGGGPWTPVPLDGGRTVLDEAGRVTENDLTGAGPVSVDIEGLSTFYGAVFRRSFTPPDAPVVPLLVGDAFLDRTGARVGDTLGATIVGVPIRVRLLDRIDAFPPLDAGKPFAVGDSLALDLARMSARATLSPTDEWWLAVDPGAAPAVAAAVAAEPLVATDVVAREAVLADLAGDPLGLGVIGILGLGSVAALLFAAVGFLVSVTVSVQERLGELALLKALGLAPGRLVAWLAAESVVLLGVGLVLGTLLGLVLAWLALPFATLTAGGQPPIPAPEVVVPPEALLPTAALGVILAAASWLLLRRVAPAARTSAVLRGRDE